MYCDRAFSKKKIIASTIIIRSVSIKIINTVENMEYLLYDGNLILAKPVFNSINIKILGNVKNHFRCSSRSSYLLLLQCPLESR